MNAIYFNIKNNGKVSNRGAYVVLGIDLEEKDILSSVTGENESSKFWLKVVNELRYMNYRIFLIFLWKLER